MVILLLLACRGPGSGPKPSDSAQARPPPAPPADPFATSFDYDNDGYSPSEGDCDDHNRAVRPNAYDTPGDGIDQDCTGTDARDDDLDGHLSIATGGDDCDDTRADVNPGSPEYCDPVDHDCDGVAYEEGSCGIVQPISDTTFMAIDTTPAFFFPGVWTDDGNASLLTNGHWNAGQDNVAVLAVLRASPNFPSIGDTSAIDYLQEPSDGRDLLAWGVAGDVDGDGWEDYLMTSKGCGFDGGVWVAPSPVTGWTPGATLSDSAVAWWGEGIQNACFGIAAGGGGDLDGDGYGDILVSQGYQDSNTWGDWGTEDDYGLWVLRGGGGQRGDAPDGTFLPASTEDARWALTYDELVGDVTGDGIGRMVIQSGNHAEGPHDIRVVNPLLDGAATYDDLVSAGDTITLPDDLFGIDPSRVSATWDWDGDGVNDLLVNADGYTNEDQIIGYQEVTVLGLEGWDGTVTGLRDREILRVEHAGTTFYDLREELSPPVSDLDGDGVPDASVFLADPGVSYDGVDCVLPSSHLSAGVNDLLDVGLCYADNRQAFIGDWDLSGKPDIAFLDTINYEGFYFVPGEDLPWDDPTVW